MGVYEAKHITGPPYLCHVAAVTEALWMTGESYGARHEGSVLLSVFHFHSLVPDMQM